MRPHRPLEASDRPRWGALYAILPLAAGAGLLTMLVPAASPWRRPAELAVAALILLLFRLWVVSNRAALTRDSGLAHGAGVIRIVYLVVPGFRARCVGPAPRVLPRSTARPALPPAPASVETGPTGKALPAHNGVAAPEQEA
jgi:hypothetical protein